MEAVFEAEIVTLVTLLYMTRFLCFFISKCWQNNIEEGYITPIFGFEVENVTLAFMNRYGCSILKMLTQNIKGGFLMTSEPKILE